MKLVVRGDPPATAACILGSETLFRLGFVADLVGIIFFLGAVLVLHELFKPVSRSLSLLMAFFGLVGSAIQALDCLSDLAALLLLKGGNTMAAFTTAQSQELAFVFLRLHPLLYDLALVFFGVFSILIGYLVLESTFLPRAVVARRFFYICAGLFLMAGAYAWGARTVGAQVGAHQEVAVLGGQIANGGTIPLPPYPDGTEALESECSWIVSLAHWVLDGGNKDAGR